MHFLSHSLLPMAVFLGLFWLPGVGHAERPMNVDDAGVGAARTGFVQTWFAREPGGGRVWNVASTYVPLTGLEVTATLSRDRTDRLTTTGLEGKFQLTRPQAGGCHHAAALELTHPRGQRGPASFSHGMMSCEVGRGAVHMNLGLFRAPGGPSLPTAGVAWERAFGAVTGYVEWEVQRDEKPTLGMGFRTELVKDIDLGASVGRNGGETLYSIGVKFEF